MIADMPDQKSLVQTDLSEGVMTLSLGAAPAHPLSLRMIQDLQTTLDQCASDPQVRVVVLHGAGRIFCAGHDMKEIASHRFDNDHGAAYLTQLFECCATMMQTLATLPQPVIAMTSGIATAGGLQLLCSCDLAFATPEATFCLPGVTNGGFCSTPSVAVGRVIGPRQVMEMALSGERYDAQWALAAGLINRIVPADDLVSQTNDFARTLATRHTPAIVSGKRTLYEQLEMPLAQAYAHATQAMIGHFMDPARIERDLQNWSK